MKFATTGAPGLALAAFLGCLLAQRLFELRLSAGHARRLASLGGVEHAAGHYPWLVALHVAWPLALIAEVTRLGARPPHAWSAWLALFLAAQGLRAWAIHSLGERWTVRIWVVPGAALVARGPYRWLRHPNYVAVALELLAAPLMFGAWRTAVAATLANALALAIRIPAEERALGQRGHPRA